MKSLPDRVKTVTIDVLGDKTKTRYTGTFKMRVVLTNTEEAEIERNYKEELPDDSGVKEELKIRIASIAELRVRITSCTAPWWGGSREGRDLLDASPIYDLITKCNIEQKAWLEQVNKEAEKENK